jgi:hypothetical protein
MRARMIAASLLLGGSLCLAGALDASAQERGRGPAGGQGGRPGYSYQGGGYRGGGHPSGGHYAQPRGYSRGYYGGYRYAPAPRHYYGRPYRPYYYGAYAPYGYGPYSYSPYYYSSPYDYAPAPYYGNGGFGIWFRF